MRTYAIEESRVTIDDGGKIVAWEVTVRERDVNGEHTRNVLDLWSAAPRRVKNELQLIQELVQGVSPSTSLTVSSPLQGRWIWLRREDGTWVWQKH